MFAFEVAAGGDDTRLDLALDLRREEALAELARVGSYEDTAAGVTGVNRLALTDADAEAYPESNEARRRLHVGATRAVHQLWLTSVGTPLSIAAVATLRAGSIPSALMPMLTKFFRR